MRPSKSSSDADLSARKRWKLVMMLSLSSIPKPERYMLTTLRLKILLNSLHSIWLLIGPLLNKISMKDVQAILLKMSSRGTMEPSLRMARQELVRHIQWLVLRTTHRKKESCQDLLMMFSKELRVIRNKHNFWSGLVI